MAMNRMQLIDAIFDEEDRVWGLDGYPEGPKEFRWLEAHYGITTREYGMWDLIARDEFDHLLPSEKRDEEVMGLLRDTFAVVMILEKVLQKYQSSTDVYPRPKK